MSEQQIRVGDTVRVVDCAVPNSADVGREGCLERINYIVRLPESRCVAREVAFVSRPRTAQESVREIERLTVEWDLRGVPTLKDLWQIRDLAREALAALEQQP